MYHYFQKESLQKHDIPVQTSYLVFMYQVFDYNPIPISKVIVRIRIKDTEKEILMSKTFLYRYSQF